MGESDTMKCQKCNGAGEIAIYEGGFNGYDECPQCHGKGYMTNEEYICTCSTEERAEMLTEMLIKTVYAFDGDIRKVEKKDLLVDVFETWLNYKYEESLPMPWEYGFARVESDGK